MYYNDLFESDMPDWDTIASTGDKYRWTSPRDASVIKGYVVGDMFYYKTKTSYRSTNVIPIKTNMRKGWAVDNNTGIASMKPQSVKIARSGAAANSDPINATHDQVNNTVSFTDTSGRYITVPYDNIKHRLI